MVTAPADRAAGAQLPTPLPTAQPGGPCRPSIGGDPLLDHLIRPQQEGRRDRQADGLRSRWMPVLGEEAG